MWYLGPYWAGQCGVAGAVVVAVDALDSEHGGGDGKGHGGEGERYQHPHHDPPAREEALALCIQRLWRRRGPHEPRTLFIHHSPVCFLFRSSFGTNAQKSFVNLFVIFILLFSSLLPITQRQSIPRQN